MKRGIILPLVITFLFTNSYIMAQQNTTQKEPRILIAYFSATGTTARVARQLAAVTGGATYAIQPAAPYTSADLDWHDSRSRSSVEMNDPQARPALQGSVDGMEAYDVVFLGYPIWWDLAPRVVNTFIENHNLKGKRIVPFATSGSSSIHGSVAALKREYPDLDWQEGRLLNQTNEETLRKWVASYGWSDCH